MGTDRIRCRRQAAASTPTIIGQISSSTITFDTFKFVDRLERAGLSREQAAGIVEAQKDAFSEPLISL